MKSNFEHRSLSPTALEVADNKGVVILGKKAVLNAQITMNNAERMKTTQPIDDVEYPALIEVDGGEMWQNRSSRQKFFGD